jgi:hypothetical protein
MAPSGSDVAGDERFWPAHSCNTRWGRQIRYQITPKNSVQADSTFKPNGAAQIPSKTGS